MGRRMAAGVLIFVLLQIACVSVWIAGSPTIGPEYESFNFIVYGDTRSATLPDAVAPLHEDIVGTYLQHDSEFIIHTGDMVLAGGIWSQWTEFNESIAAVWKAGVPFYGVVGNHEKYTDEWYQYDDDFVNYANYFDYTSVIDEPGENELYYSLEYEGMHFIFLNTEDYFNDTEGGSHEFDCSGAQMNWLLADLSNTQPDGFIVVSFHRTAWSIREGRADRWAEAETVRDDFHDVFVQNGVDLVLMGHDHYYYRTVRDGICYVTTGGGGAPLAGIDTSAPTWQQGDIAYSEYHYCNVEVNSTHVRVTALRTDDTRLDTLTIDRPAVTPTTTPTPTTKPPTTTPSTSPISLELTVIVIIGVVIIALVVLILVRRRARSKNRRRTSQ